jgi:hypothetical protein
VVLVEGRAEVCGESVRVAGCLLLGDGVRLDVCGEGCGEVGELLGAGVADARELVVDAGLNLKLLVLGASAVGLVLFYCQLLVFLFIAGVVVGSTSGFDWSDSIKLWLKRTGLSLRRVLVSAHPMALSWQEYSRVESVLLGLGSAVTHFNNLVCLQLL